MTDPSIENQPEARLLIVDDEESVVQILEELFSERPYEVETLTSGEAAIQRLSEASFDLLLTDINLPGADGMEVLRAAKEADPDIAVVVITGYASTHTAIRALRAGAHDYITKPFDLWDVDKIVERGLESRRLVAENRRLVQDLKEANSVLRRHEERLTEEVRTLYEISKEVSASLDVKKTLNSIVAQAVALTDAKSGLLFRARENTHTLIAEVGYGPAEALTARAEIETGKGLTGRVVETMTPARVAGGQDLEEDFFRELQAESVLAMPLVNKGHLMGVLIVMNKEQGSFTDRDEGLMESFASQAAIALANAELYEHTKVLDQLKSDFVAVVSHEVRTPLTSIQGSLELVLDGGYFHLEDKVRELLGICETNVGRLRVVIKDILDFSKIERDKLSLVFEEVDMTEVIGKALQAMEGIAADNGINLQLDIAPSIQPIMADKVRVGQVVMNLIDNAIKFSREGDSIEIKMEPTEEGGIACHIADSGPGIAEEDLKKLFQKFQQVDSSLTRRKGGLGLGLVISKGIVEQHGGRIWVESKINQGTRFSFILAPRQRGISPESVDLPQVA